MLHSHRSLLGVIIPCNFAMCSKHLSDSPPCSGPISPLSLPHSYLSSMVSRHPHHHSEKSIFINHQSFLKISRFLSVAPVIATRSVYLTQVEEKEANPKYPPLLLEKLEMEGIVCDSYTPGRYSRMLCPKCEGGNSNEWSFSLYIREDGDLAFWRCFRYECGWSGHTRASVDEKGYDDNGIFKEENRKLEPLSDEEKGAEKILYGLDDIKEASDIIIVEGEMDKLSMEEAGYQNCVSVPDGAPPKVSKKKPSSKDKDMKYRYLWNCEEYLKKASRIILATDADAPGQALAEELACRLGRESIRCWQVRWPIRNDSEFFKDANEVLVHLGPKVLKEVIEKAELFLPNESTI